MARLLFYSDPVCPWAWRTSQWIREARKVREIDVTWRVFSLSEINRGHDPLAAEHAQSDAVLRVAIQARRSRGNEAVDRLFLALGRARHERRDDLKDPAVVEAALREADLSPELYARALADPSTDTEAHAEHREAVERFAAFGVPWLVLNDQQFGFYGPIVTAPPQGEEAGELWDHSAWFLTRPNFYELKRERG